MSPDTPCRDGRTLNQPPATLCRGRVTGSSISRSGTPRRIYRREQQNREGNMASQLAPSEVDVVMEHALSELPVESWQVVDTRRVGARGPRVDMVLVGPPGIFVVECAT